ncbi:uncharacterized protein G2W53_022664 [Senna tora]|uniref:Uncharacterized protein n=1 Tax=Senna tora TaxID=362788 RepID=A0A834TMF2_9FABA|nr:uncharacterized protein G2W53_022664 [Senna tora]
MVCTHHNQYLHIQGQTMQVYKIAVYKMMMKVRHLQSQYEVAQKMKVYHLQSLYMLAYMEFVEVLAGNKEAIGATRGPIEIVETSQTVPETNNVGTNSCGPNNVPNPEDAPCDRCNLHCYRVPYEQCNGIATGQGSRENPLLVHRETILTTTCYTKNCPSLNKTWPGYNNTPLTSTACRLEMCPATNNLGRSFTWHKAKQPTFSRHPTYSLQVPIKGICLLQECHLTCSLHGRYRCISM